MGHCHCADPFVNLATARAEVAVAPGDLVLMASVGPVGAPVNGPAHAWPHRQPGRTAADLRHGPSTKEVDTRYLTRVEIHTALWNTLNDVLGRDIPALTDDTRLFADLMLDSTNVIELLMALEDAMGLQIDPDDLAASAFETVGTLTDYIASCPAVTRDPVS